MHLPQIPKAIEPTDVVGGCIAIFENAWENPEKTIKELEEVVSDPTNVVQFHEARTLDGSRTTRTNYDLSLTRYAYDSDVIRNINNQFWDVTFAGMNSYQPKFSPDDRFYYKEGFNVLKYQTGQEYQAHSDGGTLSGRAFSPIVYLNDEYTGGEIEFVNFNVKIKPKPGMLIIFPSNYPYAHIAHPVQTGTKYAIVTWLHDRE